MKGKKQVLSEKKKQVQTEAKKKMENNLYSRYQSYVATFQLQFGTGIRPPTYEEYIQLYLNQQCSQPANESSEVILGEKELFQLGRIS